MLRVPQPLPSTSQAGAVQRMSAVTHNDDGQQLTVPWVPFSHLLLCGGLGSVLRLGCFRLLLII